MLIHDHTLGSSTFMRGTQDVLHRCLVAGYHSASNMSIQSQAGNISALDFSGCAQCAEGSSLRSSEKMTTHEYWRESDSMTLSQFTEYYKGNYPQAFIIESHVAIAGHGLQQGKQKLSGCVHDHTFPPYCFD